jgi:alcohol dehydrogenase class IV
MNYNIKHSTGDDQIPDKQAKVKRILWSEPEVAQELAKAGLRQETADLGDLLDAIIRALGLPRSLGEMGIVQEDIPGLSTRALDDFWAPTNPIPLLKAEQVSEILEAVA